MYVLNGHQIDLYIYLQLNRCYHACFAPGHLDYARYGLCYLRNMQAMPLDILNQCRKGEHIMHHNPCSSNIVRANAHRVKLYEVRA